MCEITLFKDNAFALEVIFFGEKEEICRIFFYHFTSALSLLTPTQGIQKRADQVLVTSI